jgi:hypothetical protein
MDSGKIIVKLKRPDQKLYKSFGQAYYAKVTIQDQSILSDCPGTKANFVP